MPLVKGRMIGAARKAARMVQRGTDRQRRRSADALTSASQAAAFLLARTGTAQVWPEELRTRNRNSRTQKGRHRMSEKNPTWISDWNPEDKTYWETKGSTIARRN